MTYTCCVCGKTYANHEGYFVDGDDSERWVCYACVKKLVDEKLGEKK